MKKTVTPEMSAMFKLALEKIREAKRLASSGEAERADELLKEATELIEQA